MDTDHSSDQTVTSEEPAELVQQATFVAERPWGRFEQFCLNEPVTVKIITVEAGCRLSLQHHAHRSETWQVLDVPLTVQVGEREWTAQPGELVHVPSGAHHRLGNPGLEAGRVLEIARGTFDEADIVRLQDDYARHADHTC